MRPPVRRRWTAVAWALAAVVATLQAWGGLRRSPGDRLSDLQVYLGAVADLWRGGTLYDFAAQNGAAPFTYPPFAGLVLAPLHPIPFAVLAPLWGICTFAVVAALAWAVAGRSEIRRFDRRLLAPLLAIALFASAPISSNFRFGQVSVFLVALVAVDALAVVPERWRGVATGVAGAIKLTPMIFVPYYWFSGQRRTAIVSTITFLCGTALAWLILPSDSVRFWFTEIWNVNRVGHIATGGNQSLNGALLRAEVPESARAAIAGILGIIVVAVALYRASLAYRQGRPLLAAVIVGAAGLVFSPVSWTHHQVWLVLAVLVAAGAGPRARFVWIAVVLAIMILPVTSHGARLPGAELVLGNARLWLALALAVCLPVLRPAGTTPGIRRRTAAADPERPPQA
ncbi:glycosyltransferase 87 family protein [Actinoplanes sp. NPDC023801]|uniref:glycosyltransferase 87 family protein n=1 Tax=Actinoplanes sp. NPDC023801 TaxID=3154595 RepID=UPI0033D6CDC9